VVLSLTAACLSVAAVSSPAVAARTGEGASANQAKSDQGRFALGDSVMLGAKQAMKGLGFATVDAKESRQAYDGPRLLRQRGTGLPTNVVVHLGTNGTFPLDVCKKIVRTAGPDRRVFFLTVHVPRSWQKGNNKVIRECDAAFKADRVHVIDWDWAASRHPKWLWSDNIHLRPAGAKAFARIIDASVDAAVAEAHRAEIGSAGGSGTVGTNVG
jgi:lysophospholipase L1-like esterase